MNPKVSVIIPTYKRHAKYLSRALNSVLGQTHRNLEIVVVDDNPASSEWRTEIAEWMEQYSERQGISGSQGSADRPASPESAGFAVSQGQADTPSVLYIQNPENVGGSLARNIGIEAASGEFITFLDDDDEYLPDKVERQVRFMMETGVEMSFADLKIVSESGAFLEYHGHRHLKGLDQASLLRYHLTRKITGTPTFMYRADALRRIGGFEDAKAGQEFYLMLRTIERGLKIGYLPHCGVQVYRHAGESISTGEHKIEAERTLHELKRSYYSELTLRDRMFIRFRHHAVLARTFAKNKQGIRAAGSAVAMIVSSPVDFVVEAGHYGAEYLRQRKTKS